MAQLVNAHDTYDVVGAREDLADVIDMLTP